MSTKQIQQYTSNGLRIHNNKADCIYCGKEDHVGIMPETGIFHCLKCNAKGNFYTWLSRLLVYAEETLDDTSKLEELANRKNLQLKTLLHWGFTINPLNDQVIVPTYNLEGKPANLYRLVQSEGKDRLYQTTLCSIYPFNLGNLLTHPNIPTRLWITEGPWDGMALFEILQKIKIRELSQTLLDSSEYVISVPGANIFAPKWCDAFKSPIIALAYDHDHPTLNENGEIIYNPDGSMRIPGLDGMRRAAEIIVDTKPPDKIQLLRWAGEKEYNPEIKPGYDIRDLIQDLGPVPAWKQLKELLVDYTFSPKKGTPGRSHNNFIECRTFDDLFRFYTEGLHCTEDFKKALIVSLATVVSTPIQGEQLFVKLIGPPGSGKTTIAEAVTAANEYVYPVSIMTGFHSGYIGDKEERKEGEASLVNSINGKCVIIKDADTIVNSSRLDSILAEIRDLYDGTSRTVYRNRAKSSFENLRMSMLFCGTDELLYLNRASRGDRFLDIRITPDSKVDKYISKSLKDAYNTFTSTFSKNQSNTYNTTTLKEATYGFLRHLHHRLPTYTPKELSKHADYVITCLSKFLAKVRTRPSKNSDEMTRVNVEELPTRISKQLVKMGFCSAFVLGKQEIDDYVLAILLKLVLDTGAGVQLKVVDFIYQKTILSSRKTVAIDPQDIANNLKISRSGTYRLLQEMHEIKLVKLVKSKSSNPIEGRDKHLWRLSDEVIEWYTTIHKLSR